MSQSYGVLRVVRVRPPVRAASGQSKTGWLPEEKLVHVIGRRETSVGRALSNDIVLMDPTVSREHARLVLEHDGWNIINLTARNVVRVNGRQVPSGGECPIQSQDVLILGSTMLQFIAPRADGSEQQALTSEEAKGIYADQRTEFMRRLADVQSQRESPWEQPLPPPPEQQAPSLAPVSRRSEGQEIKVGGRFAIPSQPEPELEPQPWEEEEAENLLGAGVTMQFALPQRMGRRTRWLIAGVGLTVLLICAIITVVLNSLVGIDALVQNGASSIVAALTIPLIPALGIFLLINFIDRYEREPWYLRVGAFLWGMVVAIPSAFFIEQYINDLLNSLGPGTSDILRSALQGLNAGVTEETVKGLGLLLLFFVLKDEFDNVTDGIIYAALIGAGFAMVENFRYFAFGYKSSFVFLIIYRIILGWLGHPTFTACFGAPLGYTRHTRSRWRQIVIPLLGYLLAVTLHSFFDFVDFQAAAAIRADPQNNTVALFALIAIIGDYVPPFLAQMTLLYFLIKSLAHEAAVIREFLAVEVSSGVVTVDEYALLQNSFQRTKLERQYLFKYGFKQWLRVKALYQAEIGLAFRKWHVSMGAKQKRGYRRQPEDAYRQRIRRLRKELQLATMGTG